MRTILLILISFLISAPAVQSQSVPEPPEGFRVYVFYNDAVYTSWEVASTNHEGFRIFYSITPDTTKILARTVPAHQLSAFVENLTPGTTYDFCVAAFNSFGQSDYSNSIQITLPFVINGTPDPPTNLKLLEYTDTTVTIGWEDNSFNELGFKIAMSESVDTNFFITDSVGTDILSYQEIGLTPNTDYFFKVCAYNEYGFSDYTNTVYVRTRVSGTSIINQNNSIADGYSLGQNYPNPFNPGTKIRFTIPVNEFVEIKVYDIRGRLIDIVLNNRLSSGEYDVIWLPNNIDSGVYYYVMSAGEFRASGKMIYIK